jgi:alpha-glucosidase
VVELHLFVPTVAGTSRSFLQEDDGLTFAATEGARYRTSFEVTRTGDRIRLRADVEGDGYPEFARQAFHLIVHGARPSSVDLEDGPVRVRDGRFVLPNAGEGFTVEFAAG